MGLLKVPKISRWVLTPHAAERIADRSIKVEEVSELLTSPDGVIPQGPKWIFYKKFKHRKDNSIAAVVLEHTKEDLWVVLTVMIHFEKK